MKHLVKLLFCVLCLFIGCAEQEQELKTQESKQEVADETTEVKEPEWKEFEIVNDKYEGIEFIDWKWKIYDNHDIRVKGRVKVPETARGVSEFGLEASYVDKIGEDKVIIEQDRNSTSRNIPPGQARDYKFLFSAHPEMEPRGKLLHLIYLYHVKYF